MKRSSQFSLSRRQFRFERFLELLREKKVQNQNPEKVKPVEDFIPASKNILCLKNSFLSALLNSSTSLEAVLLIIMMIIKLSEAFITL